MTECIVTKQIYASGMTCNGCELRIEKALKNMDGILKVKANHTEGKIVLTYDENKINFSEIKKIICSINYIVKDCQQQKDPAFHPATLACIAIIIVGASIVMKHMGGFDFFNYFPEAKEGMGYGALFIIGLLTSVHCIGMCGGINLSQCIGIKGEHKLERISPSFLYNLGRVISYTIVGGLVGALGSFISFNGVMRGAVALLAGVFMMIMGLKMLNIFPWLNKLNLSLPKFINGNLGGKSNSPLYIGLINGLMPCGPLQAMQLYALSTGDPVKGAISMFLFSLGTVPLMFSFGAISSLLSKKFTSRIMAIAAVLVIVLGFNMINTGLSMSGALGIGTEISKAKSYDPLIVDGYQIVEIEVDSRGYEPITVLKDIPVKFNLHVEANKLNGCNNAIVIRQYGIQRSLTPGDNIVEFTPTETGIIPYSCWMGMIKSSITVVDNLDDATGNFDGLELQGQSEDQGNNLLPIGGCCGE